MSSLGVSLAILLVEALLAATALVILWFISHATFDALQLDVLVDSGLRAYFAEQPVLTVATVGGAVLFAFAAAAGVGYFDVGRRLVRAGLKGRGLSADDYWYVALEGARLDAKKDVAYVEVVMKSRDVLRGTVHGFSFRHLDDGSRDLLLRQPLYFRNKDTSPVTDSQSEPPAIAILNSKDIESIRVVYVDDPSRGGSAGPG